ncbi:hypothetical protein KCU71_g1401, partial [Aureobasidium melanogenum]|jgi:hypothetical protein
MIQSNNEMVLTDNFQVMDEVWDMDIPDFTLSFAPELNMADLNYGYSSVSTHTDPGQIMFANDGLYPWPFAEPDVPYITPGSS